MVKDVKFWMAILPQMGITVNRKGGKYFLDTQLIDLIGRELGDKTVLMSAGLWTKWLKYEYIKQDEKVFADSGGFQYYFLTPGKQRKFYRERDALYRYQIEVGDYVAGGDIPVGRELGRKQVEFYADLTRDNMGYQFRLDKNLGNRFINVMHGQSPVNMELWYSKVKDFPSVGWAVGAKGAGAFGNILQLLFLLEKGELKLGKLVHMFAMSGKTTLNSVIWILNSLNLDLIISSDSSSYSLGRFGAMFYNGGIVRYDEVREGKVVLELWNGKEVRDISQKLLKEEYRDLVFTSIVHFCKWFKEELLGFYQNKVEMEKMIRREEIDKVLKWFKMGGYELVWERFRTKVTGRSEVKLYGGLEVEENRTTAYRKKVRR